MVLIQLNKKWIKTNVFCAHQGEHCSAHHDNGPKQFGFGPIEQVIQSYNEKNLYIYSIFTSQRAWSYSNSNMNVSIYQAVNLSIDQSVNLSIYQSVNLSIHLSILFTWRSCSWILRPSFSRPSSALAESRWVRFASSISISTMRWKAGWDSTLPNIPLWRPSARLVDLKQRENWSFNYHNHLQIQIWSKMIFQWK